MAGPAAASPNHDGGGYVHADRDPAFHQRQARRRARAAAPQPVFNPATGEQSGTVPLASAAEVDEAVERWRARRSRPGRRPRPCAGRGSSTASCACSRRTRSGSPRRSPPSTARSIPTALGEIARGVEVVEFATGAPQLLKGEITENVGTRVDSHSLRQPLGRGRRDHAVQLPGHGADVDVPGGAGLRQLLHPQGLGARALGRP